jgi:hypothetical protein
LDPSVLLELYPDAILPWNRLRNGLDRKLTLILATVASDGFVLAADTRRIESGGGECGVCLSASRSKIYVSRNGTMTAFAENDVARLAAEILTEGLDRSDTVPADLRTEIEKAARAACQNRLSGGRDNAGTILCINPHSRQQPILRYQFGCWRDGFQGDVEYSMDTMMGGYHKTPALFFLEKYFKLPGRNRTVEDLSILAGHVLNTANHLHCDRIS